MGTTTFVWDPVSDCVLMELDETDNVKAVYTNEAKQYGGVLSQRRGNTSHYHHHDALGSTRFLTDSSGNVTDTYLNDAWGNSVASTGTTVNPFRWVGKYGYYTDNSTGQIYVRARMYQPTVARWASLDPTYSWPTSWGYAYVLSTPLILTDPSGLQSTGSPGATQVGTEPWKVTPTLVNFGACGIVDNEFKFLYEVSAAAGPACTQLWQTNKTSVSLLNKDCDWQHFTLPTIVDVWQDKKYLRNGIWKLPDTQKVTFPADKPIGQGCITIIKTDIVIGFGFVIPINPAVTNVPLETMSQADQKLLAQVQEPMLKLQTIELIFNKKNCGCCPSVLLDLLAECSDGIVIEPLGLHASNDNNPPWLNPAVVP
ncbi:MAG: RHS repeat-associated core domain-containing protein [Planctomycetaceae bacterium]